MSGMERSIHPFVVPATHPPTWSVSPLSRSPPAEMTPMMSVRLWESYSSGVVRRFATRATRQREPMARDTASLRMRRKKPSRPLPPPPLLPPLPPAERMVRGADRGGDCVDTWGLRRLWIGPEQPVRSRRGGWKAWAVWTAKAKAKSARSSGRGSRLGDGGDDCCRTIMWCGLVDRSIGRSKLWPGHKKRPPRA